MARSSDTRSVLFTCDASHISVPAAIYIAGTLPALGEWTPNLVLMYDDGTNGDRTAGDGIWSLQVELPMDATIHYKYTNSGQRGSWEPGDESPGAHRTVVVTPAGPATIVDTFGR